ncbi:MaoC family dehydratase [Polaribacter cellanae]|uniref:MaoC family dehydratase n=1 Tax=Polaribacter cellanae TaxID=2818493 RepID=A0A975CPM7_9FLAO|nr:MaoC family dehydratase [Polaribacter cellanae]QTE23373.1 MaoC family dehydratase [Polaribacter cellanae]
MKPLEFENFKEFKAMIGKQLPVGNWYTVTQEMINDFANATLDKQWIHVDENRAKTASPFKSTIAHGFMSVAMISKLLEDLFLIKNIKMGLNYGLNKVRFPNPVPVNSQLRMLAEVKEIEDLENNGIKITFSCLIEIKGQEKPACVAEFLCVLYEF